MSSAVGSKYRDKENSPHVAHVTTRILRGTAALDAVATPAAIKNTTR
jgi:hypothetical protein